MSNVRVLLIITLIAACGKPPCTNCAGCCDATGVCQPVPTQTTCGANGAMCMTCPQGQMCSPQLNQCVFSMMSGMPDAGIPDAGAGTVMTAECNTSGVAAGCMANAPFSCTNATNCFATNADCVASGQCNAMGTPSSCNTTGVATGCMANGPFSCAAAMSCFASYEGCAMSGQCPVSTTSQCNTTGVAAGCMANGPFSCAAAMHCFSSYADCAASGEC